MNFLRNKFFIIIVLVIILGVGVYFVIVNSLRKTPDLQNLDLSHYKQTQSIKTKTFTNHTMNITFSYPINLKVNQITPQLISVEGSNSKNNQNLLVYSSNIVSDTNNLNLPFPLPGKLQKLTTISLQRFDAKQAIYKDGGNETNLLILRNQNQIIVLRMPDNSDSIDDASVNEIINSLQTLN